jgi:hypothetical protein
MANKTVEVITISGGKPDKNPSIPAGGQIQFDNKDSEYTTLDWHDQNGKQDTFWKPQPTNMPNGNNNAQTAQDVAKGKTLKYKFNGKKNTGGGGTVKVGS